MLSFQITASAEELTDEYSEKYYEIRYDDDGTEIVSIMFEMKNEMDTTATKHKNEDFFKELDKDRREKGCEYAVLVSMLESDNEYYNTGIVDVSYRYPKMYVVRPQFFIPIITLLRNAAQGSLKYRRELELVKNQNIDITHFEEDMNDFKDAPSDAVIQMYMNIFEETFRITDNWGQYQRLMNI